MASPHALPDTDLVRKIKWLLFFRLILIIFCIVLVFLLAAGESLGSRFRFALYILGVALALDLFYVGIFRWVRDHTKFVVIQIVADAIFESILIYLTGGANSVFTFLFLATIFSATMCLTSTAGYLFASGVTVMLGVVTLIYAFHIYGPLPLPLIIEQDSSYIERIKRSLGFRYILVQLITHALAFHIIAALGGYLASRLLKYRVLYEEILDNMAEGLIAIDASGRIIYINDEARRLLSHHGRDPLIFRNIGEVFRRREEQRIVEILIHREETDSELKITMREGEAKDINIKTSVLKDSRGRPRGLIGIFTDLTPRKRLEEAERKALRLQDAELLATSIAHEIRNPLASIRGAIQELANVVNEETSAGLIENGPVQLADIAVRESDRLEHIIGNFLRFARMGPPQFRKLDISELIDEVVILLKQRSDTRDITITADVPQDLRINGDAEQLKQAFLNLGVNALEAMKNSDKPSSFTISADAQHSAGRVTKSSAELVVTKRQMVEIRFVDTGPGIKEEDLAKIFAPFYTTRTDGTGLGLSIVHKIVEMHGGTSEIENTTTGACVRIRLPMVADKTPDEESTP
jgi:two-component system sensor histidine kinase PilS (NtrC family)